jgi:hypothetical protein
MFLILPYLKFEASRRLNAMKSSRTISRVRLELISNVSKTVSASIIKTSFEKTSLFTIFVLQD